MNTKKTITAITAAAALALGLAACAVPDTESYDSSSDGYEATAPNYGGTEDTSLDEYFTDGFSEEDAMDMAWDLIDADMQDLTCDLWNSGDQMLRQDFIDGFVMGSNYMFNESDAVAFMGRVC